MTPVASWLLVISGVCGFAALGSLAVWCWLKLDVWVWNYLNERVAKQEYAESIRSYLEAHGYRLSYEDGTPVYIRVNLITPERPRMEVEG